MAKILIVGCGDIGYQVALSLHRLGHSVTGLKRQVPSANTPFPILSVDIRQLAALSEVPVDFDAVLLMVSPGSRFAEAYQALYVTGLDNLLAHFAKAERMPSWLMVSSSSVYGQHRGEWVDESSPTQPENATSRYLVEAEKRLRATGGRHCVVRFSGIYGPGRDWLLRRAARGDSVQQQPPSYTNRIHRDDCVAVLLFLLEKQLAGVALQSCYLASDDDPAPLWEVMAWIAKQYGYAEPPALPATEDAPQNKRCCNARLTALGYRWLYPSYREGYLGMESIAP